MLAVFALNFGGFFGAAMSQPPDRLVPYSYFLIPPAIVLVLSPVVLFLLKRRSYRPDGISLPARPLLFAGEYELPYRNVKSVTLSHGLLGRVTGLGRLRFSTPVQGIYPAFSRAFANVTREGIVLRGHSRSRSGIGPDSGTDRCTEALIRRKRDQIRRENASWFLYLIECADGALYTGIALDPAARYAQHQMGKGAKYTRANPPLRLIGTMA